MSARSSVSRSSFSASVSLCLIPLLLLQPMPKRRSRLLPAARRSLLRILLLAVFATSSSFSLQQTEARQQQQQQPRNFCSWQSENATFAVLECIISLDAFDSSVGGEGKDSLQQPAPTLATSAHNTVQLKTLRLLCSPPTSDGSVSLNSGGRRPHLRDILDAAQTLVETELLQRQPSSPFRHAGAVSELQHLQVINCPLRDLQRLDLLYIASSPLTSNLIGLAVSRPGQGNEEVVEDKSIVVIEDGRVFEDAPGDLRQLELSSLGLESLPPSSLCPLRSSLASLNLSSNAVSDILDIGLGNEGSGRGRGFGRQRSCPMTRLSRLDLSHNDLDFLPDLGLALAPTLQELDLSWNGLRRMKTRALGGLAQLQILNLAHNKLPGLPAELFSSTLDLSELYVSNNTLTDDGLPLGLFDRLQNLMVLNLSQNAITNKWLSGVGVGEREGAGRQRQNRTPLQSLNNLVALDLSRNRLTSVSGRDFQGLSSLQVLTVAQNHIHTCADATFASAKGLHALVLSFNRIESLPDRVFDGLTKLNSLAIDHNKIKSLNSDIFRNCSSSLQDLSLHSNRFRHVPHPALRSLGSNLRTLDLGENLISELHPNALAGLDQLYGLRLAGNRLDRLSEKVFAQAQNIKMLNLADNRIEEIEQNAFLPLKKLKALRLDNNLLEDINGLLTTQHHLQWLNVSHNRLQWFDYAFVPKSLLWLNLQANQIEELENYYDMNEGFHLVHLDVSKNAIARLDRQNLVHSLKEVHLNGNQISELAANTFTGLANLTLVNLTQNKLAKFSLNSLSLTLPKVEGRKVDFYLSDNPVECDCEMDWMQRINDLAKKSPSEFPYIADWSNLTCSLNNRYLGKDKVESGLTVHGVSNVSEDGSGDNRLVLPLSHVQASEFICPYSTHCFALCMCCDFFACDCRMKCSDGCDCYHDQTWSANVIQCGRRQHAQVPEFIPMDATHIYLDGNNLTDLSTETFIGRKHLTALYLNSSHIRQISNKTFNGLSELLVLHLERNSIRELRGGEFRELESLRELHLDHNRLEHIHANTFSHLTRLQVLGLAHNRLTTFPVWETTGGGNIALRSLRLAGNAWSCECAFLKNLQQLLRRDAASDAVVVDDADQVTCVPSDGGDPLAIVVGRNSSSCADVMAVSFSRTSDGNGAGDAGNGSGGGSGFGLASLVPGIIIVCSAFLIVVSLIVLAVAFRKPVSHWVQSKCGNSVRILDPSSISAAANSATHGRHLRQNGSNKCGVVLPTGEGRLSPPGVGGAMDTTAANVAGPQSRRLFDFYVHYSIKDNVFVQQNLIGPLDANNASDSTSEKCYRYVLHHRRDLVDPHELHDTSVDSLLDASSRVILMASVDYLQNEHTRAEMAHILANMAVRSRARHVVVIALHTDKKQLKKTFLSEGSNRQCIVLDWNDSSFWHKLKSHLPEPTAPSAKVGHATTTTTNKNGSSSDYVDDDMWTYLKGAGNLHMHSGSSSTEGGPDSSVSTRSTTDNSNTLPFSSSLFTNTSLANTTVSTVSKQQQQQQLPTRRNVSTLQPHNSSRLQQQQQQQHDFALPTTRTSSRSRGGARTRTPSSSKSPSVFENPLDSDYYVSVHDSLQRPPQPPRTSTSSRPLASTTASKEPIYHTLEPPSACSPGPAPTAKGQPTVYINADLEVVYPRRLNQHQQQQFMHEDSNADFAEDEDEELLADDDDDVVQDVDEEEDEDGLFDDRLFSRSRAGSCSYVPSPAPGSFPRHNHQSRSPPQQQPPPEVVNTASFRGRTNFGGTPGRALARAPQLSHHNQQEPGGYFI